ncbi:class I mannose-6-phosphate isomerase [Aestuariimicrobium kwangyangense]|uniref:class I mannose-6-phosphate isomerase n=1 Tax=Aestuariimicrobium kwangyangense TaxID=396389 RepID=UPI0003B3550A|nr:class I mannose-6-phosphate isomerase [Aestuariimicrobium kwangyangense]
MTYRDDHPRNYDRWPVVEVPDGAATSGAEVWTTLVAAAGERDGGRPVLVVDTYPGVDLDLLRQQVGRVWGDHDVVDVEDEAALPIAEIDQMVQANLTDDRVFGVLSHHRLEDFYDHHRLAAVSDRVENAVRPTLVVGWGAALVAPERALLVLADLARWEIQQRLRAGMPNWRCSEPEDDILRAYKRGFFVEWRVADRHKRRLFDRLDFVLDTNSAEPHLLDGTGFRAGLSEAASRPFRVVPFFDPGVWGGQWMKEVVGLDRTVEKFAWCFDCVPEENSLLLERDGVVTQVPAMDLVLNHPRELLGERTFARFGAEFPIRFDFLDTMEGGNLSLQVHPLTDYIQRTFGMHYTQDESYYLLDAGPDAVVYLGIKDGVDPDEMVAALRRAEAGDEPFPAERYVNTFPARTHDHFLIPAGTVHCSGADSMVLEISATPFIFTFKMWDWGRVGLDGRPRPVHLDHAEANIAWERRTDWVGQNLVDRVEQVSSGEGWSEERTGLHELEFIETRRHWFTGPVEHDTAGTVNVLNLVEGDAAVVESPSGAFAPFEVHYAETFIVPAAVGRYTIRPLGEGDRWGTVKAYVRGT